MPNGNNPWGSAFRFGMDPSGALGPGEGGRPWYEQIADPAGMFGEGGMLGPPGGVEFGGEMYRPGAEGGFGAGLLGAAQGRGGPSAAEGLLGMGLESATRRGQAVAATQRGVSPALAARMGSQQAAAMSMDATRQAAMLRAQEQQRAQEAYLQLEQQRGQQQMAYNQLLMQQALQEQQSAQQAQGGMLGAAGGLIGGILSDERAKVEIAPASGEIREFLGALKPLSYAYRDPAAQGARPGQQFGVLAQDAAQTTVGESMMIRHPERLELDPVVAVSVLLATVADMHGRIVVLEGLAAEDKPEAGGDDA